MFMDLVRLQHIVAVARTSSFSRAAKEACITQPALSRSIAAFEARYGVRLFERGRGGTVSTPAGRMVVARAREILAAAHELEDSLGAHAAGNAGEVTLGLGPLVASLILPPLGRRMLAIRPKLKLRTMIKPSAALLAEESLELLLASPNQPEALIDFDVRTIARLHLAIVVRADHPLAGRSEILTAELAEWPAAGQISELASTGAEAGMFACENYHVLREVIGASDCYWCTSAAFLAEEIADGRLHILNVVDYPIRELEIAIMRRRNRTPSPAALAVEEEATRLLEGFGCD